MRKNLYDTSLSSPFNPEMQTMRYPAPEIKDLPEDILSRVLEVQEKAGFVPNVFLAL